MKRFFSGLLLGVISLASMAIPSPGTLFKVTQPDGSVISLRAIGDEYYHYLVSEDGYVVVVDGGVYWYAQAGEDGRPVASNHRVAAPGCRAKATERFLESVETESMLQSMRMDAADNFKKLRHAPDKGPGLFIDATFPTTGEQKVLVILADFQDVKFRLPNPADYFTRMLNEEGFSDWGGTGSARDYYMKSSEGMFIPSFDVYGPVTLPQKMGYYGANSANGHDGLQVRDIAVHACQQADADIDFTEYDRDGDGVIDNVFIYYAGLGEANGGAPESIWPHSADAPAGYTFDGKKLQSYGCTCEWVVRGGKERPDGIGAFCHEFAHVLGLPDLYATAAVSPAPFTPGAWTLLDQGTYCNDGCTPPLLGLFSRYALGWWEPKMIESPMNAHLPPFETAGDGFMIRTGNPNEYFLIENRQRTGWDKYLPGHGLLVWHIDYDPAVWILFAVNNDASHQRVDIVEADGIASESTRSGDSFPGVSNVTTLDLRTWSGASIGLPISDISEYPDGTVSFLVKGGAEPTPAVKVLEPENVTPRSFTARWQTAENAVGYKLRVFTRLNGEESTVPGYDYRNVANSPSCEVVGLEPSTEYFYTVCAITETSQSLPSDAMRAATLPLTHEYVIPEFLEPSSVGESGFTLSWKEEDSADDYKIDIALRRLSGTETETEAFDGKVAYWNTSSAVFYGNTTYTGKTAPSLRLGNSDYIVSPSVGNDPIRSFSFWHRGHSTQEAVLAVEVFANGCWSLWQTIEPVTEKGGCVIRLTGFPEGSMALRLTLLDKSGGAQVYVDDFELVYGGRETLTPNISAYTGNCIEYKAEGLQQGEEYMCTLKAISAGTESMPSKPMYVRTLGVSGVSEREYEHPVDAYHINGCKADDESRGLLIVNGKKIIQLK